MHDWDALEPGAGGQTGTGGHTGTGGQTTGTGGQTTGGTGGAPEEACPPLDPLVDPADPKILYVSATGSNAGDGTEAQPLSDLATAIAKLGADGGVIYMMGGEPFPPQNAGTASGTIERPIRIRAAPGQKPVIVGDGATTGETAALYFDHADHLSIEGVEIHSARYGIRVYEQVHDFTVRGCDLHDIAGTAIHAFGADMRFEANHLKTVATAGDRSCLEIIRNLHGPNPALRAAGVAIRGNVIEDCRDTGIFVILSDGVIVDRNFVEAPLGGGVYLANSSATPSVISRNFVRASRGVVLADSVYSDPSNMALTPAKDVRVENNILATTLGAIVFWFEEKDPNFLPTEIRTYSNLTLRHNTILARRAPQQTLDAQAIGLAHVLPSAPAPKGCLAASNVLIEDDPSSGDAQNIADGWTFQDNLWSPQKPILAGPLDVEETESQLGVPDAVTTPEDVIPLAQKSGHGSPTDLTTDFYCHPRNPESPARGAIEPQN